MVGQLERVWGRGIIELGGRDSKHPIAGGGKNKGKLLEALWGDGNLAWGWYSGRLVKKFSFSET